MVRPRERFPFQTALNFPRSCLRTVTFSPSHLIQTALINLFTSSKASRFVPIATRLEESYIIADAQAFYDYVVYTGLDLTIQVR